jgi:hypothetical protein
MTLFLMPKSQFLCVEDSVTVREKQTTTPPLEQTPLGFESNMTIYLN